MTLFNGSMKGVSTDLAAVNDAGCATSDTALLIFVGMLRTEAILFVLQVLGTVVHGAARMADDDTIHHNTARDG